MKVIKATTQQDFFSIVHLRTEVFVLEQQVDIRIEQDELDLTASHYIVWNQTEAVGCLRILFQEDCAVIGRVAVKKEARRQHVGKALLEAIETDPEVIEKGRITLHAQTSALPFYLKCGYTICSKPYYEAGIEHVMMEKIL